MFAAAVRADPSVLPDDVGDSKDIAPERREELAVAIHDAADAVAVAEIPVDRIDADDTDMNALTVAAHVEALTGVAQDGDEGYVDAGDTNAVRFERNVSNGVPADVDLRAEHGADATYPIVGAASIIAKVRRDAHVASLTAEYGDVGSGYPSDPTTREFLRAFVADNDALPDCARASWQTSQDALAAAEQSSLADF
jgi:ribonuclease HII